MPRSMTGFGVADGGVRGGRLQVEIRTLNHRYFNAHLKLGSGLQEMEARVRDCLRERFERGHVTLSTRWLLEPSRPSNLRVNVERAREIVGVLREIKAALALPGDVDLAFVARQPEVLALVEADAARPDWNEIYPVLERAIGHVVTMRTQEGAALGAELADRLRAIGELLAEVERRAPERITLEYERLRAAVQRLLDGSIADENRLAQEIALLADKLDVTEETVRLRAHIRACADALQEEGSAGRRLGFLGQEMLREINTIGSKANDAAIAQSVIAMKGELEKFREQVENVE